MAGTPSTRAQGQGAAQVFDTSGLANQYGQQLEGERQRKAAALKEREKKIAELAGNEDVFKEKYFATRDDKMIRQKWNDIQKEFSGKWNLVADPTSPEGQRYREMNQELFFTAKQSEESKQLAQPFIKEIGINPKEWEPESLQYIKEFQDTPGMIFDPTRVKKVNNTDLDKWFNTEVIPSHVKMIENNNQKNLGFNDKGNYTVTGTVTRATDKDIESTMNLALQNISADPAKLDKLHKVYDEEVAQLNAAGEEVDVFDLFNRDYRKKLGYDKSDIKYAGASGETVEPFNPNNIVEDFSLKTGGDLNTLFGAVGEGIDFNVGDLGIIKDKTKMYQTSPVRTILPISTNVINIQTGEKYKGTGTFNMTMGSPLKYKGDVYVPALLDGTNESVLIPMNEVKEVFEKKGYDTDKITQSLLGKSSGSKSTVKTGSVVDGYEFLGGDTKDPKNWKKI